jgi:hypothetical protein
MAEEHPELKDRYPWALDAVLREQLKSVKDTQRKRVQAASEKKK